MGFEARVEQLILIVEIHVDAVIGLLNATVEFADLSLNLGNLSMHLIMHIRYITVHGMERTR